jgi:hypothetical protein
LETVPKDSEVEIPVISSTDGSPPQRTHSARTSALKSARCLYLTQSLAVTGDAVWGCQTYGAQHVLGGMHHIAIGIVV